jgi:A/G-specific adenine glycosylase
MSNKVKSEKRSNCDDEESINDVDFEDFDGDIFIEDDRKDYSFSEEKMQKLTENLLTWYDSNHRELPWRKNPDSSKINNEQSVKYESKDINQRAYEIWISEIMSQQTRLAAVISYYEKWMKEFPDIQSLANADLEDVHRVWSGLGYYRRADNIHSAAKKIAKEMEGNFPKTAKSLMKLPGIGKYTAGAIASIVFNERAPIVDGNILRLFSRLQMISKDISKQKNCNDYFWSLSEQLVNQKSLPEKRVGDLNQSLMEMGAMVCTSKNPKCNECCVREQCMAYDSLIKGKVGTVEVWPVKKKKNQKTKRVVAVCIITRDSENGEEYYIMKNCSQGLLANLYQFPSITVSEDIDKMEAKQILQTYIKKNTNLEIPENLELPMTYCGNVQHIFTHIDMQLMVFSMKLDKVALKSSIQSDHEIISTFVTEAGFDDYGIPTVVRKVLQKYLTKQQNPFKPKVFNNKKKEEQSEPRNKKSIQSKPKKQKRKLEDEENGNTTGKKTNTRSQANLLSYFGK